MIVSMPDSWSSAADTHRKYVVAVIDNALNGSVRNNILKWLLTTHADSLALGKPRELVKVIREVNEKLSVADNSAKESFHSQAKLVFDYDLFASKQSKGWNAYALCKSSSYRLCPYCQQAYAFTLAVSATDSASKGVTRGYRPTLDHYFCKSTYPYLGLSLYNLVPACHTCNSSLKSTKDFFKDEHLHPLQDEEKLRFTIDAQDYLRYRTGRGLSLTVSCNDPAFSTQAQNSIDTFLLNERYAANESEIARFVEALQRWSPDAIKELVKFASGTASSLSDEVVLFSFDYHAYKHEMLGVIKRDLYEALRKRF